MNFKPEQISPTLGYALIKPAVKENVTKSGIILPVNELERPQYGEVVATAGHTIIDGKVVPFGMKLGTIVIFKQWSGSEVEFDGEKYQFVKFEDILGEIKESK